jgi:hypothetical protein
MYYPKSQIKTGFITNGNEYILSTTLENYKGSYFKISTGKVFTGKNPNESSIELLPFNSRYNTTTNSNSPTLSNKANPEKTIAPITKQAAILSPEDFKKYAKYDSNSSVYSNTVDVKTRVIPQFSPTYPTEQEKEKGIFTRYFCKKNNERKYIEISKASHNKLANKDDSIAWDLYTSFSFPWYIKGNRDETYIRNQSSVSKIESQLNYIGFSKYFKGKFLQYFLED